jgi:hypothetical protein
VAILFTDIKQPNRFSRRWMASRLAGTFASDPGALRRRSLRSQVSARWRTIADRTTRVSTCTWSNRWNPTFYWRCWPGWHRGAAVKRTRLDDIGGTGVVRRRTLRIIAVTHAWRAASAIRSAGCAGCAIHIFAAIVGAPAQPQQTCKSQQAKPPIVAVFAVGVTGGGSAGARAAAGRAPAWGGLRQGRHRAGQGDRQNYSGSAGKER